MKNLFKGKASSEILEMRPLDADEIDQVAGGRIKAIVVLGDCTTPPIHSMDGIRVIVYNPWISPGSPERRGTGTSF